MRATTGRDLVVKIEGTYHGHHDALMVSVFPPPDKAGPREHPASVPQTDGMIPGTTDWVVNVPFNDLEAAQGVFAERGEQIAGMIVEPVMTNCGVVLPDPGYLEGLKVTCHTHGAMLGFDEVKTGFTVAWGGAIEAFGVQPDLVAFAKALGAGLPCGAVGGTEAAMTRVIAGTLDQVGTFNGNPLTMAAAKVNLEEVLTKDAYVRIDEIDAILRRCEDVIARYGLPATMKTLGAKGAIDWSRTPIHEYRDLWAIDDRIPQLAWLWQLNRGVFKSPGSKWESWTTSIVMSDADAERYVANFEEMAEAITR
jgi:glutamate-1-semialdehyde 2,1-aminomutase